MFSENEVRALETSLYAFEDENTKHQKSIANVLEKYGQLLSDFKSLQSDYEETKEARERYKKMAKGQDKSPFVLLLVDGDGYYFDESLVKQGADGGIKAATTMQNVMQDRLSRMGLPDETKIIVKIYMNLQGVSQAFHRYGSTGSQARAIAPFTSAFSKCELYDIVDCGENRECCEAKIKENFDLYVDNASCRHVFFAGCESKTHLPFIKRYNGRKDHITLIRAAKHAPEFDDLGYNIEELPGVFRKSKPDDYLFSAPPPSAPSEPASWKARPSRDFGSIDEQRDSGWGNKSVAPYDEWRDHRGVRPDAPICTHYIRGICKYGVRCAKRHEIPPDPRGNGVLDGFGPRRAAAADNWRTPAAAARRTPAPAPPQSVHSGGDRSVWEDMLDGVDVANALPRPESPWKDMIPINKDGYRLDFYHGPWNRDDAADYQAQISMAKPCNSFQLTGHCKNGITCHYDHAPMEPRLLEILKQIVHDYPCKMRGACRDKDCHVGHICYNPGCNQGRRGPGCRLHWTMHQIDPKVVDWVPAQVAEPTDIKPIPNNEEDLLIESLEEDMDAPDVLPSTKNFELTSAWAQSVLSPTPSQLPTPTATVLESAVERESTLAEEKSRRWHEAAGRDRETNIDEMHEHFQPAARAKDQEGRPAGDAWNTAQDHEYSSEEPQNAPQEHQSPLISSRWNSVDESSRSEHPAAQAAGWGNETDSYDAPAKHYPSPPTSNSPAPSRLAKEDRHSNGRLPPTPARPVSRSGKKLDARAWKPPRGPVSDSYIGSSLNEWDDPATSQSQGVWPAPVQEDDGPYGW